MRKKAKKKIKLTKAQERAFDAWNETISDETMLETAPINIWHAAFSAGVASALSPPPKARRKGK